MDAFRSIGYKHEPGDLADIIHNMLQRRQLTKEQNNALRNFEECLYSASGYQNWLDLVQEEDFHTNNTFFLQGHVAVRDLPSPRCGIWCASRVAKEASSGDGAIRINFRKVTTRTTRRSKKQMSSKLWVFYVSDLVMNMTYTFVWVEEGVAVLDENILEELSFLAPFVDPKTASELGWMNSLPSTPVQTPPSTTQTQSSPALSPFSSPTLFSFSPERSAPPPCTLVDVSEFNVF